jgi:hypothetical protein
MSTLRYKLPTSLKHGLYSTAGLLPGENEAAFRLLHERFIGEFAPCGPMEEHTVANLARLVWRRDHLEVLRVGEIAQRRIDALYRRRLAAAGGSDDASKDTASSDGMVDEAVSEEAHMELGHACDLAEMGASESRLVQEMELRGRLDALIDKALKRLLCVRGVKSLGAIAPAGRLAGISSVHAPLQPAGGATHLQDAERPVIYNSR